jgi:hypothetical protein
MSAKRDPHIRRRQLACDFTCIVRRMVINDEHADVHPILRQHAMNATVQILGVVVAGNYHVDSTHEMKVAISMPRELTESVSCQTTS